MAILIVDDSAIIRRSIARAARSLGFEDIHFAGDGEEAVRQFQAVNPLVVTLDITMPHVDGLSCLNQLMQIKPEARVLIVSALADTDTAMEALHLGASGYVVKPFSAAEIEEALSLTLGIAEDS